MFKQPQYLNHSCSIFFPRISTIRRKAFDLETYLGQQYAIPHIIPIPDELDPEIPRIVISSKHGFSIIQISQISLTMHVRYSPDYQTNHAKIRTYLDERLPKLFDIVNILDVKPLFCGLTGELRLLSNFSEQEMHDFALQKFNYLRFNPDIYDFELKTTHIHAETFFANIALSNYRERQRYTDGLEPASFIDNSVIRTGFLINGDFNDRYAFYSQPNYECRVTVLDHLLDVTFESFDQTAQQIIS